MKKVLFVFSLLVTCAISISSAVTTQDLETVWRDFRSNHPFGLQTVGVKHEGGECVFVISEPNENVSLEDLSSLFKRYNGIVEVKHALFGYDGWLGDAVGSIRFEDSMKEEDFRNELFRLLYGTDYKSYYLDLDHPVPHTYFAPYKFRLNHSISVADLESWFITQGEKFGELSENEVVRADKSVKNLMANSIPQTNQLYYSKEPGFVAWVVDPQKITNSDLVFKQNARRFALDTDLIIGAFGKVGKNVVIIARERQIPVEILPPLRIETLVLLATTNNESLAQSYERYHIFASKLKTGEDVAPIYLSDELWHSEYGNLLNVTDQMLKSWSENGRIDYKNFNHPKPIDWTFNRGAIKDLKGDELTYNWNTAGAGYVIRGDDYDVIAVNRTGSLPVSYIPGGMEGHVEEKVYEAEEKAYDFFSGLNSPELARVVQYATFYQIFNYFKNGTRQEMGKSAISSNVTPDYRVFDGYVEQLLRFSGKGVITKETQEYQGALSRFSKRFLSSNARKRLSELLENDPYNEFVDYLSSSRDSALMDSILVNEPTNEVIENAFLAYLEPSVDTMKAYIDSYELRFGSFPYREAAQYAVSPRDLTIKINNVQDVEGIDEYQRKVDEYNTAIRALQTEANELSSAIDAYNKKVDRGTATSDEQIRLKVRQMTLSWRSDSIDRVRASIDKEEARILAKIEKKNRITNPLKALIMNEHQQQALGALNWLLTDPTPYDEPSGSFFASQLTTHRQWMKSPSMACSTIDIGYGGHNLDAHVTPIEIARGNMAKNLKPGFGRVSFRNGKPIVYAVEKDMKCITPDFLRKVERQIITEQEIKLPDPPKGKPKEAFLGLKHEGKERGMEIKEDRTVNQSLDGLYVDSKKSLVDYFKEMAQSKDVTNTILDIEEYSAREIKVIAKTQQGNILNEQLIERSSNNIFDLTKCDFENIDIENNSDDVITVTAVEAKRTLFPNLLGKVKLYMTIVKNGASDIGKNITELLSRPAREIDNVTKLKSYIKSDIGGELLEFKASVEDLETLPIIGFNTINNINTNENNEYELVLAA